MDFILEEAYAHAYMPFFEVLKNFRAIKINLHFSGYLFSWLYKNKPEYIKLLQELKRRGQIEIVSGGMYEPVLSLVPEEDGISQIKMHMDYMEDVFGERPQGIWLAERVYEPHMPKILNKAGVSHTLVDDNHFKATGMTEEELYGYFITECEGHKLFIFPGLEFLRYAIPFKPVDTLDQYFRGIEEKGGDLAVFGDDGEKFGLWPGTYSYVYQENWLRIFFSYLSENKDWLKTVTFSEYMSDKPPKGLIYLDCASYREMGEWCLPARVTNDYSVCMNNPEMGYKLFVKGGYFKNFLVKYPESNDMHKKMLAVTKKAKKDSEAKKHVFMAQCNDSYWHGVFGGLYLPHLRASVYNHLIEAEKHLEPKKPFVEGCVEDVNMDGSEEAILNNNNIKAYFLLKKGGVLYELDYKPSSANIMATLQRRYEGYHDKVKLAASTDIADGKKAIHDMVLAKEEGLDQYLYYDWYGRSSLIDHVMGMDLSLESFYRGRYVEPGDFVTEPYRGVITKDKKLVRLSMKRDGNYWMNHKGLPLSISKDIVLHEGQDGLFIDYLVEGGVTEPFYLGIEFNFSFLGSGGERYMETKHGRWPLTTNKVLQPSRKVLFHDPYQHVEINLELDEPFAIWTFPVEIVSLSESGFEKNYQSTMLMPVWYVDLAKESKRIQMKLHLNGLGSNHNIQ
jgi:alpha-amylase